MYVGLCMYVSSFNDIMVTNRNMVQYRMDTRYDCWIVRLKSMKNPGNKVTIVFIRKAKVMRSWSARGPLCVQGVVTLESAQQTRTFHHLIHKIHKFIAASRPTHYGLSEPRRLLNKIVLAAARWFHPITSVRSECQKGQVKINGEEKWQCNFSASSFSF